MALPSHQAPTSSVSDIESLPIDEFWLGFGLSGCPSFEGKSVLEVGSGKGGRAVEIVRHGAVRVVGVDPSETEAPIARQFSAQCGLADRTEFITGYIEDLPAETFDVIVSENTIEHVLDVPALLAEMRRRLNPSGRCYLGFGPLYHAPDGDHGWLRATLPGWPAFIWPWGHIVFRSYALGKLSQVHGRSVTDTRHWPYLNLNEHTVDEYYRMFSNSGMRVHEFRTNYVTSIKGKTIAAAARIPFLRKYCTLNINAILIKE